MTGRFAKLHRPERPAADGTMAGGEDLHWLRSPTCFGAAKTRTTPPSLPLKVAKQISSIFVLSMVDNHHLDRAQKTLSTASHSQQQQQFLLPKQTQRKRERVIVESNATAGAILCAVGEGGRERGGSSSSCVLVSSHRSIIHHHHQQRLCSAQRVCSGDDLNFGAFFFLNAMILRYRWDQFQQQPEVSRSHRPSRIAGRHGVRQFAVDPSSIIDD